ncbi:XRE family transcriptional regulator [Kutzneria sp. CA-103260]|uniref:XRE family transcriptional regulator n=1 Tax=Kutzneria sp. CA-103260 TaxID=2802641 RepID=UPI001BA8D33E|nr:XRE family transcriptional regulator [Kutzneria sp. CA-103260]QUQ63285.1 NACHT domain-containing protein [Kutzneria sp. CA-103260]
MVSPLGQLLSVLRERADWTQEELAHRAGVSVSTIRRLETGKPFKPRVDTVHALADALAESPVVTAEDGQRLLDAFSGKTVADPPPPRRARPPAWDALAGAADEFAQAVHDRWLDEEEQRGIQDPVPLPVRWRPAPVGLADDPADLSGELADIAEVYRRIPAGRLVVLGRAGSGKTVLTLRFVLDYLRTRTSDDPVPVIFSVGSWNPDASTLREWLIDRLQRDFPDSPGLAALAHGGTTLAAALINTGRVLPVLDGFDEIAPSLHEAALTALNRTEQPLVLTSRCEEYGAAVRKPGVLSRAAAVELVDLTPSDLVDYLARGQRWLPVLKRLPAAVAEALRTPLMAVLARTVYRDQDPAQLLDADRFPTPAAIEDHLLASFVPAVYRRQPWRRSWDPERVQRWLGYLAVHVDQHDDQDGQDLAWWRLGDSMSRSSRILIVLLAAALVTAVCNWLTVSPLYLFGELAGIGFGGWLLDGLLIGSVVGLAFGLLYGLMIVFGGLEFEPSRVQLRLFGHRSTTGYRLARTVVARCAAGLLGGFAVGLGYASATTLERMILYPQYSGLVAVRVTLVNAVVLGIVFGLAAALVLGLMAVLEAPLDIGSAATPIGLLNTNRATVVRQVLMLAPMIAVTIIFGGAVVVDLLQSSLGPLLWPLNAALIIGIVGGLSGALSYALAFTAWGQWVVLSRVWLPLTGRLPWATVTFLRDAYQRGVLRQAGAVYQFRHARLKDHLGEAFGGEVRRWSPSGPGRSSP